MEAFMPDRAEVYSQIEKFKFWQFLLIVALALPALAAGILSTVDTFTLLQPPAFRDF